MSIQSIDEYIKQFPPETQEKLQKIRAEINALSPEISEAMAYGIPTFKYKNKNLVHFAAYNRHIGFYPTSSGIAAFKVKLRRYKWAKGSVQFPLEGIIPYDLIIEITKFRISEVDSK